VWLPDPGVNVILGGGDVGKSTILDAVALLLSGNNPSGISDIDFWRRDTQPGFEIEAVMTLPEAIGVNRQSKTTPQEFAEANGFRLLPEDNVATNHQQGGRFRSD
jgi:recombinational DNA repair ATPase RecF